ncbi:MAG: hypothetical protein IH891_08225 [Planctomycetes bacterium]|nr:hypothetical protein [Planctomycetota bacterium]
MAKTALDLRMAIRRDRLLIDAMTLLANDDRDCYQILSDDSTSRDREGADPVWQESNPAY